MLESFRSGNFSYKKLTEEEQLKRGILGRLVGIIADSKHPTRNDRKYGAKLWQKVFDSDIMKEKLENHCCFGELGHPADRLEVDPEKIAICLAEKPKIADDGQLYGVFDILPTPNGKILKTLCDYGCNIGVSSRGTGDLYTDDYGNEAVDPETYQCECFDAVLIPAVKAARLLYVTESLAANNKSLTEALNKELENASEEDRKVMKEAIDTFNLGGEYDDLELTDSPYENFESEYEQEQELRKELAEEDELMIGDEVICKVDNNRKGTISDIKGDQYYVEFPEDEESPAREDSYYEQDLEKVITESAEEPFRDDPNLVVEAKEEEQELEHGDKVSYNGRQGFVNKVNKDKVVVEFGETEDQPAEELEVNISDLKGVLYNESTDESREDKEAEEVVDDKSDGLVAELKEALEQIQKLKADNKSLQEQLSVCNAKETELTEQLTKYKLATANLSDKAKEIKPLTESLKEKDALVKASKNKLKASKVELDSLRESKMSAEAKLTELNESIESISKQLESSKQLVEKYRKSYSALKESYLETKACSLGLQTSEVKKNLNESYKIADIDKTCQKLYEQKQNINKLPFAVNNSTKIQFKLADDYIGHIKTELSDDYISPWLTQYIE